MLRVEGYVPFVQICFPRSVHSLVFCKVPIHMQERRGEGCDTVQRGIGLRVRAIPVTLCFRRVAQPPKLYLFDLDICTLQETATNWLKQITQVNVVGRNLSVC